MKKSCWLLALAVLCTGSLMAQNDHIGDGIASVVSIAGEASTTTVKDSAAVPEVVVPEWKKKLYYGYNFDIYYHSNSRTLRKENGWSIALEPEIGWRLKEKVYLGLRVGGTYQDTYETYTDGANQSQTVRVQQGSWNVTPYMRYRLKTMFNGKVGVWLEAHLYAGMEYPRVSDGVVKGTDYDGLRHSITYGAQVSPVITYQFNKKSTFQLFFSILSLGYSGTTYCYVDAEGKRYNENTNDVIIFSGKLRNLLANQLVPGLYGLKFGVQKSF